MPPSDLSEMSDLSHPSDKSFHLAPCLLNMVKESRFVWPSRGSTRNFVAEKVFSFSVETEMRETKGPGSCFRGL